RHRSHRPIGGVRNNRTRRVGPIAALVVPDGCRMSSIHAQEIISPRVFTRMFIDNERFNRVPSCCDGPPGSWTMHHFLEATDIQLRAAYVEHSRSFGRAAL